MKIFIKGYSDNEVDCTCKSPEELIDLAGSIRCHYLPEYEKEFWQVIQLAEEKANYCVDYSTIAKQIFWLTRDSQHPAVIRNLEKAKWMCAPSSDADADKVGAVYDAMKSYSYEEYRYYELDEEKRKISEKQYELWYGLRKECLDEKISIDDNSMLGCTYIRNHK